VYIFKAIDADIRTVTIQCIQDFPCKKILFISTYTDVVDVCKWCEKRSHPRRRFKHPSNRNSSISDCCCNTSRNFVWCVKRIKDRSLYFGYILAVAVFTFRIVPDKCEQFLCQRKIWHIGSLPMIDIVRLPYWIQYKL